MGNVLNRETMGFQTKRVHNWCSWILTAIFFVVVIIYAGKLTLEKFVILTNFFFFKKKII